MSRCAGNRFVVAVIVAVGAVAVTPALAHAHSLNLDNDPNRPLWKYLWFGFLHMATGWDHLLFIAGVVLLAGGLGSAAKLISLFVAGHSLTLLVATLAKSQLDPTLVDVVIALSVVYVGVRGARGRPLDLKIDGPIVFAFGLVHGLGLSTRLQDLGLPEGGLVERVLLFNVGVEIGQLTAIAIIVGLGTLIARRLRAKVTVQRVASAGLIAAGLIAAVVLGLSGGETEDSLAADRYGPNCSVGEATPPTASGDSHPGKNFYTPTETAPGGDLAHVIFDGYIIVSYRPNLPVAQWQRLRAWVMKGQKAVIGASLAGQTEAVRAVTAKRQLGCSELDLAALTKFRDDWFDEVRGQTAG